MSDITLLYGDEDFMIDEELRSIRERSASGLGSERVDGSGGDIDAVVNALTSMPMLAGRKLVEIRDLEYEEEDEGKLFSAIDGLAEGVDVVFVTYGSVDRRRRFFKKIESAGKAVEFKRFSEWEQDKVMSWLTSRARTYGKSVSASAAELLIDIAGMDLRSLDSELAKISTFIGDRGSIEADDVRKMASSGEMNSFELSNAVRDKDLPYAMDLIERLFRDNEDPHSMIGMLAKLYRMLLQVKYLEQKGKGQYEIASALNSKPFFVKKCLEKTRLYTIEELAGDIRLLQEADVRMKTGYPPRLTMEMLIPELCRG